MVYLVKLYALLSDRDRDTVFVQFPELQQQLNNLPPGWQELVNLAAAIASSSDKVNLPNSHLSQEITHPISAERQPYHDPNLSNLQNIPNFSATDIKEIFWWCWRFLPEIQADLLRPAHAILPDCPVHSYQSTISAIVGATYSPNQEKEHPYLFLFTFSPVQEFIKASRKFLDFWAGSYLLHYLGAKLCWKIAELYGPDAVITPSLWSQEIIDALIVKEFDTNGRSIFQDSFRTYTGSDPASRFDNFESTSLSTAGFPNVITALVPGKEAAKNLAKTLQETLKQEWLENISHPVRQEVKTRTIEFLQNPDNRAQIANILNEFPPADRQNCEQDIQNWQQHGCWEWNKLWDEQIGKTWETYWIAVPLGNPDAETLTIEPTNSNYQNWKQGQNDLALPRDPDSVPTLAEENAYTEQINVGTWWGSLQARLGQAIQAVKNTRNWTIPTAPGERSTLSGQYSAIHPRFNYSDRFQNGFGLSAGSLRLFWRLMAAVYPGLFNGSEKLNAIELTKRMAWQYGGVAAALGIDLSQDRQTETGIGEEDYYIPLQEIDYGKLIRFPNLSSIAASNFAYKHPQKIREYWVILKNLIETELPDQLQEFGSRTRARPFQIPKTDAQINPQNSRGQNFNGVMFSSKWLADDMRLNQVSSETEANSDQVQKLRQLVEQAHKEAGFTGGSPADWWAIVLADGDGMGKYVSGSKLKNYQDYLVVNAIEESVRQTEAFDELLRIKKRMGPATHVGLNRALLDFSNRLVPYITEHRCCGKVVYSGGDDVMAVLPLADLPEFLRSLRAAWCGGQDPQQEFESTGGYWQPTKALPSLKQRPYFTMGKGATMSMGIVIAHKSVPLPTVLENLWTAEKYRAKKLHGKDGLCFRVIYGSGNTLEALMKGNLLDRWWKFMQHCQPHQPTQPLDLSPILYRLAEDLPRHACIDIKNRLICQAAQVILNRREQDLPAKVEKYLLIWLARWENWADTKNQMKMDLLGTDEKDLVNLLRFSAFWCDKMVQQDEWGRR